MTTESITVPRSPATAFQLKIFKNRSVVFEENARLWMSAALGAADLFSLSAAVYLASQMRQLPGVVSEPAYVQIILLLAVTLVIMFARKGLYPAVGLNYVDELGQIVSSTSFTFLVMLGITFVLKTTSHYSRLILGITWILSLVFIPFSRYMVRRVLIHLQMWGESVVIIGHSNSTSSFVEHFSTNPQLGLRPVAVLNDDHAAGCNLDEHFTETAYGVLAQARSLSLQTALVVIDDLNQIDALVERFRNVFHRVILIKDKNGRFALNGLESLDFSNVMGLQVKNNLLDPWSQAFKRLIDICASLLGLVLLAPLFGLVAILIKLDDPGRIFYRQTRLGRNGKPFCLLKFRTMHLNADRVLQESLARDPELKAEWDRYQKLKKDPRITRVGKFLRRFSLDELPQLWNIAQGEMSLVGPRPMMLDQRELYGDTIENYMRVSPGITGFWQVSGRNQTTFNQRAELDNEYIQRWSLWLDIFILLKTIKVVFAQKGAY